MARLRVLKISLVLIVLMCTHTWLCYSADLIDAKAFSQALSKLVTEGLGVADLQVRNISSTYFDCGNIHEVSKASASAVKLQRVHQALKTLSQYTFNIDISKDVKTFPVAFQKWHLYTTHYDILGLPLNAGEGVIELIYQSVIFVEKAVYIIKKR